MKFNLDDSISSRASMSGDLMGSTVGNKLSGSEDSCCPTLTLKQRLIGYGVCTGLGMVRPFISLYRFHHKSSELRSTILSHFRKHLTFRYPLQFWNFPQSWWVSNISIIPFRSLFLSGPKKQFKSMFEKKRIISTIVLLSAITLTLVCALLIKNAILTLICAIV